MITLTKDTKTLSFEATLADAITLSKMISVRYGSKKFNPKKMGKIKNRSFCKPEGGLWVSPVDSKFGWKDWCEVEDFRDCKESNSFKVSFKDDAKVIIIDSYDDLDKLPSMNPYKDIPTLASYGDRFPDFEKLAKEVDAIWLTEEGQWKTRMTNPKNLYGWDCESILVLNPNSIKQIEKY